MNCVKVFNTEVKEIRNKAYEECSIIFEVFDSLSNEIIQAVVEAEIVSTAESYDEFEDENKELWKLSELRTSELSSRFIKYMNTLDRRLWELIDKCTPYIKSKKESNQILARRKLTFKSIADQSLNYLKLLDEELKEQLPLILENKRLLCKYTNWKYEENSNIYEDEVVEINSKEYKILKIFDYKEMEKLAVSNDYKYKWSSGSHRVYEHAKSKKIIVIPSHELGYGLSVKIQKQIYKNIT